MELTDIGIGFQILGFSLMLSKLGESLFFELYFVRHYGVKWRKKAWLGTPDMKNHKFGIMTLWGRSVPAIEVKQSDYYFSHSIIPDKLHSVGIGFIIFGLILHFSFLNPS